MATYHGFIDGAIQHTQNLASTTWVIYSPTDELIASGGICLGLATNNVAEYQATIGLMTEALSSGISHLVIHLDSHLVVLQLNGAYSIHDPTLLRLFRRIRLLERSFEFIRYYYVPRRFNKIVDSLENFILDWHLSHL